MLYAFIIGIITWTLAEYILHRFLGHVHKGKNFFKAEHLQHHAKANYFAPAYKKAALGLLVISSLTALIALFLPWLTALAFAIGFGGMYSLYEITHYRFHSTDPIIMPFLVLRKHHFYHHFHNPKYNHGVTTRIWDRVFGTFKKVEQVRVPYQMSMDWLLDNNQIKEVYNQHFKITGIRTPAISH